MLVMKEEKEWLIITFDTTTDAMRMEKEAKAAGVPGRIIPLPTQISAGCGFSWRADPKERDSLTGFMDERGLRYGEVILLSHGDGSSGPHEIYERKIVL